MLLQHMPAPHALRVHAGVPAPAERAAQRRGVQLADRALALVLDHLPVPRRTPAARGLERGRVGDGVRVRVLGRVRVRVVGPPWPEPRRALEVCGIEEPFRVLRHQGIGQPSEMGPRTEERLGELVERRVDEDGIRVVWRNIVRFRARAQKSAPTIPFSSLGVSLKGTEAAKGARDVV